MGHPRRLQLNFQTGPALGSVVHGECLACVIPRYRITYSLKIWASLGAFKSLIFLSWWSTLKFTCRWQAIDLALGWGGMVVLLLHSRYISIIHSFWWRKIFGEGFVIEAISYLIRTLLLITWWTFSLAMIEGTAILIKLQRFFLSLTFVTGEDAAVAGIYLHRLIKTPRTALQTNIISIKRTSIRRMIPLFSQNLHHRCQFHWLAFGDDWVFVLIKWRMSWKLWVDSIRRSQRCVTYTFIL